MKMRIEGEIWIIDVGKSYVLQINGDTTTVFTISDDIQETKVPSDALLKAIKEILQTVK